MPSVRAIPVEQLDRKTGEVVAVHDSAYAAADALGATGGASSINKVANGKAKSAYGFVWRYKLDAEDADGEEWRRFEDVEVSSHGRVRRTTAAGQTFVMECKPLVTINKQTWHTSQLLAHVFLGAPADDTRIAVKITGDTVCVNKRKREDGADAASLAKHKRKDGAPVQQWTHNGARLLNEYASVSAAATELGLQASHILKCMSENKTAGGFTWKYADA